MKKAFFIGLSILWMSWAPAFSQLLPNLGGQRVGTAAAQFLKIGIGARGVAMGESFVAVANDAEALYWNPAGIAQFTENTLITSHIQWLVDIQLEYLGVVFHLNRANTIGIAATSLHTPDMDETTELQPFGTGRKFHFGDFASAFTYARNMTDKFSFGITLKLIQETIAEVTMQSVLFDLGTFYKTGWRSIRFAVAVTNFGSEIAPKGTVEYYNLDNQKVEVKNFQSFSPPTIFRIGIAWEPFQTEQHRLTTSIQLNHPNDNKENINAGLEYSWRERLAFRLGYKTARVEESFSAGFGLQVPTSFANLRLDYAYTHFGRLGFVNRFSLQIQFGGRKS